MFNRIYERAIIVAISVCAVLFLCYYGIGIVADQATAMLTTVTGADNLWGFSWAVTWAGWIVLIGVVLAFGILMGWVIYKDRRGKG
jgi:hypothetical protein